ncbi:MAG: orotate phosphoribosyltransferase [Candidatus Omnitrophota bacterium]
MMTTNSAEKDKARLFAILTRDAFFKEKITLSSGKESDYYLDARRVTLSAEGAYLSAKIILDMVKDEDLDAIGGPTLGADPIVGAIAVLSYQARNPLNTFIIRKSPKAHGKQQQVEGPLLRKGAKVVLIDDVATTGQAFLQSLDVLKSAGVTASKAVCLVDRGEGAREALAQRGCELLSIYNASDFFKS